MESSRKAKAPSDLNIRHAKNGGYIVRHSYDNFGAGESYRPSEEHAFGDHKAMIAHVHKHTVGGSVGAADVKHGEAHRTGVSGPAKASPPTRRTHGAGVD